MHLTPRASYPPVAGSKRDVWSNLGLYFTCGDFANTSERLTDKDEIMKHKLFVLILCLFVGSLASCEPNPTSVASDAETATAVLSPVAETSPTPTAMVRDDHELVTPQPESGTWERIRFTSQALAGNLLNDPEVRTIRIHLPPGYEAGDARYPVVFVLHGYLENPSWMTGMGPKLDTLVANGEAQNMILVFPDGNNLLGGSQYLSSLTIGDYESYIARELVAYVDANYRTIASREARGIAGCSMGGNGALHLAFTFPDVFGTAAGVSGGYAYEDYPQFRQALELDADQLILESLDEVSRLPWYARVFYSYAAAIAPNPDKSPFYFDFPLEIIDGHAQVVPEVLEKITSANVVNDAREYLNQPLRLRGIAIYHGALDDLVPLSMATSFSEVLTDLSIEHEFVEVDNDGHCDPQWDYSDLLRFISANLAHE